MTVVINERLELDMWNMEMSSIINIFTPYVVCKLQIKNMATMWIFGALTQPTQRTQNLGAFFTNYSK
jgi:hypothetical protein